jgi:hypothetical protein
MAWEVLTAPEFDAWWHSLDDDERESLRTSIQLLRSLGRMLGRPHADSLRGARHSNMKELRTQHRGRPLRTLFAFDPLRRAILLIGGDKTGDERFYERMIPLADAIMDRHLQEVAQVLQKRKGG